jgi:glycosyltransferase involved in cell wall biosynthesis
MRILFLSYTYWPPHFGGELLIAIERLESLARLGHRVTVLTAGTTRLNRIPSAPGMRVVESPAVHESRPGRVLRRFLFACWAFLHLARSDYDVVHFGSLPGLGRATDSLLGWAFAAVANWRRKRAVAVHSLADSEMSAFDASGFRGWLRLRFLRRLDRLVCVSPALYESARKHLAGAMVCLPYGIRDDLLAPVADGPRTAFRERFGAGPHDPVFAFLGSPTRRKGFDVLLRAFSGLRNRHPDYQLWVIGPASRAESQNLDDDALALVAEARSQDGVVIFGRVDNRDLLRTILGSADVFVFPTRREGMPLAPMEAMALGLPVIVSKIPGVTDLANIEGVTGFYVKPGSVGELEAAMERLGSDEDLRRRMGSAARSRVVSEFGWRRHVEAWAAIYEGRPLP